LDAGVNSKIIFPKDEKSDLALLQQYLVFQIFLPPPQLAFGIDLIITDTSKVLNILKNSKKYITPFFTRQKEE